MADTQYDYGSTPSLTNGAGDGSDFILHARTLAPLANRVSDLLPSSLLCFFDFLLLGFTLYRWWRPPWQGRRADVQLLSAVGIFSLAIGFMVRAIVSNTAAVTRSGVLAQEIFFFLGQLALADAAITLTRDLLVETAQLAHPHIFFTLGARIVLVIAFALNVAGDSFITDPPSRDLPTGLPTRLRLWGGILSFAVISLNLFLYNLGSIPFLRNRPQINPLGQVFVMNLSAWFTSFYTFMLVSVTYDDWSLEKGTVWFYICFGFFLAVTGILLAVLNVERFFGPPRSYFFFG